eukprot:scaffold68358_cov15-Tisochrysis_lutea.AAC.2
MEIVCIMHKVIMLVYSRCLGSETGTHTPSCPSPKSSQGIQAAKSLCSLINCVIEGADKSPCPQSQLTTR